MEEKSVRILVGGMGNAARPMMELFISEAPRLAQSLGIVFSIVGVADSRGAAVSPQGLDPKIIMQTKEENGTVSALADFGHPGMTAQEMIDCCEADIYIDGLPPFLPTGEPGTGNIRAALEKGIHVVTANKAPVALYWQELFALAEEKQLHLRYGTAASAGLPSLELGKMLGDCGELLEFGGIFNASCMYIIQEMKKGIPFDAAVEGAKQGGFLEPNPSMDIDGWDSAMKTVIQANTYWNQHCTLNDVAICGIRDLSPEQIQASAQKGEVWCMVSRAKMTDGGLVMSVQPESLPVDHPLAKARWCDKALWMKTRTQGEQVHYCLDASASSTPGNMFLDAVLIAGTLAGKH